MRKLKSCKLMTNKIVGINESTIQICVESLRPENIEIREQFMRVGYFTALETTKVLCSISNCGC